MLRQRADVDAREMFGVTALHFAAMKGYVSTLSLLAQEGADVNAQNHNRWTALHYAARHEQPLAISRLIELGARADLKNRRQNFTPLQLAKHFDQTAAVILLHEAQQ